MNYIFVALISILNIACSVPINKEFKTTQESIDEISERLYVEDDIHIYDLKTIPQDVDHYLNNINDNREFYEIQKRYEKYYFSIWNIDEPRESLQEVMWPFASYSSENSYGENLQPLKQNFFNEMLEEANFKNFSSVNARAVTLINSDIRGFPTDKPVLKDPSIAGEGFPFDYLQNSTVHANKPVFISHYSKSKEWAHIFTSFTSGWVKSNNLVLIDKQYTDLWQKAKQVVITKEGVPIYDENNNFLFNSKIGMMFALISEDDLSYKVLAVSSYKKTKPLFVKSIISKEIAKAGILKFTTKNLKNIINETKKTNYGWGGMYGQRDCSSMLRDIYAPFGIWLPRNSFQQSRVGDIISLDDMSDNEKINIIKDKAIPFETLLYKKGHIVLYVGIYNDEIIVFHNTWGIKTKKDGVEGRVVIGRPLFSTLQLGKHQENYDKDAEILKNLKSMNIITR